MSVVVKENLQQKLSDLVKDLPVEKIIEVIDFAEFLHGRNGGKKNQIEETKERIFGQYDGQGFVSDDFNDYLGDEFWFGEDFGIIEKENEFTT